MEEGLLPHHYSLDTHAQLEEERRLLYVAMTRARSRLYLTHAAARARWGITHVCEPSRFVSDLRHVATLDGATRAALAPADSVLAADAY